jgi:hypothetical protein
LSKTAMIPIRLGGVFCVYFYCSRLVRLETARMLMIYWRLLVFLDIGFAGGFGEDWCKLLFYLLLVKSTKQERG